MKKQLRGTYFVLAAALAAGVLTAGCKSGGGGGMTEAEKASWRHPEIDVLGALKKRIEPLLEESLYMAKGVGGPVRFDLTESEPRTGVVMSVLRRAGAAWEMTAIGEFHDGKTARAMYAPAEAVVRGLAP